VTDALSVLSPVGFAAGGASFLATVFATRRRGRGDAPFHRTAGPPMDDKGSGSMKVTAKKRSSAEDDVLET